VEAWQASCEDGLMWCSGLRSDVEFSTEDLEEIDRFLSGLQAVSSGASASKSGSEVWSNDQNLSVRSERSEKTERCVNFGGGTQVHGEMQEDMPDEPMECCSQCGRSFWARRLQVHESVCKGAHPEARRIFESRQQRLRGLPKVEVKSSKTSVVAKPKHPQKQFGIRAEQQGAEQPKVKRGKAFVTPVKPKAKPKASPASPSVPFRRPAGRKELDTPPRIEKDTVRAKKATVLKELPEVRWRPEEVQNEVQLFLEESPVRQQIGSPQNQDLKRAVRPHADAKKVTKLRCWAFSEETVPLPCAESLCRPTSDQERFFESSDSQTNFCLEEMSLAAESVEVVPEQVASHETTGDEDASEASELLNGWIQHESVRTEDLKSDKDSNKDPEFELLRPDFTDNTSRLALVSEAAALCAQVDAMLEGEQSAEKSKSLDFRHEALNDPNILVGLYGPDEANPVVPPLPYDPSKYVEDLTDVTSSLGWLKRCTNQIQQRRCEFEQWQSSALQK